MSTPTVANILEEARQNIHQAVSAENGSQNQRSAAHHAQSLANTVILDNDATAGQREQARYYLEEAIGIQTLTAG